MRKLAIMALLPATMAVAVEIVEINRPSPTIVAQPAPVQPVVVDVRLPEPPSPPAKEDASAFGSNITEVKDIHVEVVGDLYEHVNTTTRRSEIRPIKQNEPPVIETAKVVVPVEETLLTPPPEESSDPILLVHYFCRMWKGCDYERMWWAMSPEYRLQVQKKEFVKVFVADKDRNGGLDDGNIEGGATYNRKGATMSVKLSFAFEGASARKAKVHAVQTKDGWRIGDSGIIPVNLDRL